MKCSLVSSLLIVPALLLGCSRSGTRAAAAPATVRAQVVRSVSAEVPQSLAATGTLRAQETATLSAQVPGEIRRVLVQAGDRVRAGEVLVVLDDAALRSALNEASDAAEAARRQQMAARSEASLAAETLARYEVLKQENSVSPQEFDEVQKRSQAAQLRLESYAAQTRQAQAAVSGARTELGYTKLRAPFDGVITARLADPGTVAAPGVPLLQVDRNGPLQVVTTVDESAIAWVRTGMTVPVSVDGEAGQMNARVAQIVPAADPASHSFQVKLDLASEKNLRAGMYATAEFPGAAREAILAPISAVTMRGSLACVYAVDAEGVAQLRYVTLGNEHGGQVEVLSGVAAGETLVNQPGDRDLAGKRIEARSEAQP